MTRPHLHGILLGTADATPQPDRGPSATFVHHDTHRFLVDIGSGAIQKLAAFGISASSLDALYLTHAHGDHLGDLLYLLFGIGVGVIAREHPLKLIGSAMTLGYVREFYDVFARWTDRVPERFEWMEVEAGARFTLGALKVQTHAVHHTDGSLAYRWTHPDGASIAITGDTGAHRELAEFVRGVNTLIVECGSDPENPVPTHLSPEQLLALLQTARPKVAHIVHCAATLDRTALDSLVQTSYDGVAHLANDGDRFYV